MLIVDPISSRDEKQGIHVQNSFRCPEIDDKLTRVTTLCAVNDAKKESQQLSSKSIREQDLQYVD